MSRKAAAVVLAVVFAVGMLFVVVMGPPGEKAPATQQEGACPSAGASFNTWLANQSAVYDEDLQARYGIQSVTTVCGDVTVNTLIAEEAGTLAESACTLLSGAVTSVPSVESVTVRYGTGKNACFRWPGGISNFD